MIEWNPITGRASERIIEKIPCPGHGGLPHEEPYTDEYGSRVTCQGCTPYTDGFKRVVRFKRRPEYDAPRPEEAAA